MGQTLLCRATLFVSLCLGFLATSYALPPDELPDHPQPQPSAARATLISPPTARSTQPKAIDGHFVLWSVVSFGATIADVESTRHAIESCGLREVNPLYGQNPSRAKLYAINLPITGIQNVLGWYVRKHRPNSKIWLLLPLTNTAVHSTGFINNIAKCH